MTEETKNILRKADAEAGRAARESANRTNRLTFHLEKDGEPVSWSDHAHVAMAEFFQAKALEYGRVQEAQTLAEAAERLGIEVPEEAGRFRDMSPLGFRSRPFTASNGLRIWWETEVVEREPDEGYEF